MGEYATIDKKTEAQIQNTEKQKVMIKNIVRTSEPKNQKFHKHNEPQPKFRCSYKKKKRVHSFSLS